MTSKNELLKRTVLAPSSVARLRVGDLLSVELTADEHIQWIWCHHGARGSSVIGYTLGSREPVTVRDKQPIGFFPLEELERRVSEWEANPNDGSSWPEVKERILKKS